MFDRKDKPELYELLRTNKSKLGKLSAQEKEEQAVSAPAAAPSDSETIPFTTPPPSTASPYPKLRMPFPMLKPKEPTGVFQKPKPKPARPQGDPVGRPQGDPMSRPKINEPRTPLNYPKIIVIGGVVGAIIVILYLALALPKTTPPTQGETTAPANRTPETPPPATSAGRTWSIRLIYYTNNAEGSRAITNMCRMLREKNITVFTKSEALNGVSCNSVYLGEYSSLEQAQKELTKELPKLTKVHYKLKGASVVELKEGR